MPRLPGIATIGTPAESGGMPTKEHGPVLKAIHGQSASWGE
jgi:hypothetical protein